MQYFSRLLLSLFLFFTVFAVLADTEDQASPPGFEADSSRPEAQVNIAPALTDNRPVTQQCESAWHNYDKPICQCIPGDTILPSANNKVLSFLFNNDANTDATMSVQGWKGGRCAITFTEGTLSRSCHFSSATLKTLMDNLLNPAQFDTNSNFAVTLTKECQGQS